MASPARVPVQQRLNDRFTLSLAKNESVASILLKLEQAPSREVAMEAPTHLRVFRNPVAMRLLQRKAEDLDLDVTIISQDDMTRHLCAETGFACYPDSSATGRGESRPFRLATPRIGGGLGKVEGAAGIVLLLLIFFVGYFVLPAATIRVTPAQAALTLDVPVVADTNSTAADPSAGKIPAHIITSGDVEGSSTVTATGQRDVPGQASRGFVTFTNRTDQPVTVPKSTVLLAGKTAFFTLSDTQVSPSLNIAGTAIPGSGSASVQASDPGDGGDVAAGAITAVQGALASKVTVVNHTAFTGGTNKKAAYLSADDQAKAKQALLDSLRQQALAKITSQIASNESFLPSPESNGEGAIEELTYADSPEQVTTETTLHMKILIRGISFQGDDVNQVVAQAMEKAVRDKSPDARLSNSPLTIDPPVVVSNDGSTVKLQVHTTGRLITPLNAATLAARVRGMTPTQAKNSLQALPGVGQADVQLWPAWVRKVPAFAWRVSATINQPAS